MYGTSHLDCGKSGLGILVTASVSTHGECIWVGARYSESSHLTSCRQQAAGWHTKEVTLLQCFHGMAHTSKWQLNIWKVEQPSTLPACHIWAADLQVGTVKAAQQMDHLLLCGKGSISPRRGSRRPTWTLPAGVLPQAGRDICQGWVETCSSCRWCVRWSPPEHTWYLSQSAVKSQGFH